MDKRLEIQLLDAALAALRAQGIEARRLKEPRPKDRHDGKVEVALDGKVLARHLVEVKRHVTMATTGAILDQMRTANATLLVTDHVGPDVADRLKTEGMQFADAGGNAFIQGPGVLVWVKGNRPIRPPAHDLQMDLRKKTATRAFEPAGVKVLFAFLCDPELVNKPYREIADKAGVAHGTVGWVMAELPHRGFAFDFGPDAGGRQLRQIEQLLGEWAAAYARKLRPNLLLGRYRAKNREWWKEFDPARYGGVLGAEPAAAKITRHLRPEVITVYADNLAPRMLLEQGLRADPAGDVEIAKRFWNFETDETKKGLAPLPLIYADLLATGDPRCIEAAALIRERYLAAGPAR